MTFIVIVIVIDTIFDTMKTKPYMYYFAPMKYDQGQMQDQRERRKDDKEDSLTSL